MRFLILSIFSVSVLSGCVTSTPDHLFSQETIPVGDGAKTGQYPSIGENREGQTQQLSDQDVRSIKEDLRQSVAGKAAASQSKNSKKEIEKLRQQVLKEQQKRLEAIESGQSD